MIVTGIDRRVSDGRAGRRRERRGERITTETAEGTEVTESMVGDACVKSDDGEFWESGAIRAT